MHRLGHPCIPVALSAARSPSAASGRDCSCSCGAGAPAVELAPRRSPSACVSPSGKQHGRGYSGAAPRPRAASVRRAPRRASHSCSVSSPTAGTANARPTWPHPTLPHPPVPRQSSNHRISQLRSTGARVGAAVMPTALTLPNRPAPFGTFPSKSPRYTGASTQHDHEIYRYELPACIVELPLPVRLALASACSVAD